MSTTPTRIQYLLKFRFPKGIKEKKEAGSMNSFNKLNFSNNSSSSHHNEVSCDIFDNSLHVKTGKVLALSIVLLSSFVGNILLIITVYKREELQKTINYFIVNMAVSDIIYPLTDIPIALTKQASSSDLWYIRGTAGLTFCKLIKYLEHVSVCVSMASLIWIALDRFVAVVFPMRVHLVSTKFRIFAIASTWIVAMLLNSTDLFAYGLIEEIGKGAICKYLNNSPFSFMEGKVHLYVFHIVPLITLTILYCAVALTLRRHDKVLRCDAVHQEDQRKRQAIKMSLCVIGAFCLCSLPITIENALSEYEVTMSCPFYKPFLFICDLLFFLSTTINPIICFAFVSSYRRGLTEMFKPKPNWGRNKRARTRNIQETEGREGIRLQSIRVVTELRENHAFTDS